MALWLGAPPLVAACLASVNARSAMHGVARWWARGVVRRLGVQLEIAGLEHIAPGARYVVAPLHEGFADVLALLHLPLHLRFAARDELFAWRFLGRYLCAAGHLRVSPEQGSRGYRQLRKTAGDVFDVGESLVVFPQGTILGIETDFSPGAFALARATQRPLLPVALTGSHRVWEHPFSPRLRYGQRISMCVLPPIPPKRFCDEDLDAIRREVQRCLKAAALDGKMALPRRFVPEQDGYWDGYAYGIDPEFPALAEQVAWHRRTQHHGQILGANS
jgi:1-acyl-sn-glycerol-3-phosphate acyltransferase